MAPATEQHSEAAESHGLEPWQYIQIGIVLAIITAVELLASYSADLGVDLGNALIPVLIALSAIKFVGVVAFYMHLRYDSQLFTRLFAGSLALGTLVLLALITLFWNDITDII